MRVLIVEDAPDFAQLLEMLVARCGHDVETVATGRAALDRAEQTRPELVLVDLGLPGMDGYEVASRMRSDIGLADAKIMALSGYASDERRNREAGIDGHLMKPLKMSLLKSLLDGQACTVKFGQRKTG